MGDFSITCSTEAAEVRDDRGGEGGGQGEDVGGGEEAGGGEQGLGGEGSV